MQTTMLVFDLQINAQGFYTNQSIIFTILMGINRIV